MLEDFAWLVERYAAALLAPTGVKNKRIMDLYISLSQIQTAILLMPWPEEEPVMMRAERPNYDDIYRRIGNLFPELGYYWQCLQPYDLNTEPKYGAGDIIDDLTDIYLDLKVGLNLWHLNHRDLAQWHWKWRFDNHWGKHSIAAMRQIHDVLYDG